MDIKSEIKKEFCDNVEENDQNLKSEAKFEDSQNIDLFVQTGIDIKHEPFNLFEQDLECDQQVSEFEESLESQNPWPHLEDYFVFKSRDKGNYNILYFQCNLCQPKKTIKGHTSSLHNLKSHIKRSHTPHSIQFEETIKAGSSRGKHRQSSGSSANIRSKSHLSRPPAKKICLSTNGEESDHLADDALVHQNEVDRRIVDLFICNILPLHVVESPSFINLIKKLNPSKTSMSRRTLERRILARHKELEEYLISLLNNVSWVATSADCWSVHNKSYLGMMAHWLDPKTRRRQHAVLACSRLREHHSFDVLAEAMIDIHSKFHLQDKVTRTTMDNGSNFLKTFVQFGTETDLLPRIPEPSAYRDVDGIEDVEPDVDLEAGAVDEVDYISVEATLKESSSFGHNLPVLMRCAAHTFNLVASVDADMALNSTPFKLAYRNTMSKAKVLWDQQSHSTVLADKILVELERRLVVPNSTSWNSTYDSVVDLNNLLEKRKDAVDKVMTYLKLQTFTDSEVGFLKEYSKVMSIIAKALDKIQGKFQAYLGCLLPTVAAAVIKLKSAKSKGLLYCSPLVDAILAGITKRFGPLIEDQECQLAAAFHPRFRLFWLEEHNHSQFCKVKKAMEIAVETALRETIEDGSSTSSNEDEEDDFFNSIIQHQENKNHRSLKSKAQNLVKTWLEAGSKEVLTDVSFFCEQVLIDLFIKYNTAIPSSAAVERLFSTGGKGILMANGSTLSDSNFERLLFMKGNQHYIEAMEKDQETKQSEGIN